jgi:hypothetical protein
MAQISVDNLIKYHYGELSTVEQQNTQQALNSNWDLNEKYKVIANSTNGINRLAAQTTQHDPKNAIRNILAYAEHKAKLIKN